MTDKKWNKIQFWIGITIIALLVLGLAVWIISAIPKKLSYKDLVSEANYGQNPVKIYARMQSPPRDYYELEITDPEEIEFITSNIRKITYEETSNAWGGSALIWELTFSDGEVVTVGSFLFVREELYRRKSSPESDAIYEFFSQRMVLVERE